MIAESTKSDRGNNDCNSVNDENRNTISKSIIKYYKIYF